MQKFLLSITTAAVIAAPYTSARAAEQCVWAAQNATYNCKPIYNQYDIYEWAATCSVAYSDTTKTVTFSGVTAFGKCEDKGTSLGHVCDKLISINASTSNDTSKHCWCKMTSPFVSKWVLASITDQSDYHCSYICEGAMSTESLRNAMLNNPA